MDDIRTSGAGVATQRTAETIARKYGASVTPLNYKSESSIVSKVRRGDKLKDIKDLARTTIYTSNASDIPKIVKELERNGAHFRTKWQTDKNKFAGYSGVIINMRYKGNRYTEIQVNTDRMIYAKEKFGVAVKILGAKRYRELYRSTGAYGGWGHDYYDDIRGDKGKKGRRKKGAAVYESINYYSQFK